jgi:multiple sugar transport system permease protein
VSATAATARKGARPGRLGRVAVALRRRRSEIGLLAPTVLILLGLSLYPTIYNFWQSLQTSQLVGPSTFGGLKNYKDLFSDHRFWSSSLVTLQFMAITVTATMVLGLALAVALDRVTDRTRRLLLPLVIMPMAMSPIVVGLIFKFLYNDAVGPINWFIGLIGPNPDNSFLAQTSTAVWAVAVVDIWQWTPFAVLVFLAALQSLPGGPIEAARIDGAGSIATFFYVRLPMIKTELMVVFLLRTLDSFRIFDVVYATTRGGPGTSTETLSIYLQRVAFSFLDFGYAGAMSIFLIIVAVILVRPLSRRLRFGA